MPTIDPNLVPTVQPGSLFSVFTATGSSLNIRWLTAQDPVFYDVMNRPMADIAVRQLIISKAIDALQVRLGHQNAFPYIIQPLVDLGSSTVDVPLSLIWDLHVSLPKKWEWIRLAKIKRISGSNTGGSGSEGDYSGILRLIFTGQESGSNTETAIFKADYVIDSNLSFQVQSVEIVTSLEESVALNSGESETVAGYVIFRTLDVTDSTVQTFLDAVAPPPVTTTDSEGLFVTPAEYEIADNAAGGSAVENDFSTQSFSHGTGMLTASAINNIPSLDSDLNTWLSTFNYPFRDDATLVSSTPSGVTIPTGLFKEFKLIAPNNDRPSDDTSGNYFPVWISRISRDDVNADQVTMYFATFNTSDDPSTTPIEFAKLVLLRTNTADDIIAITPNDDLFPLAEDSALSDQFQQGFGYGHVRLSNIWGITDGEVADFFDSMLPFAGTTYDFSFTMTSTAVSSFGLSRVPSTIPTVGESAALSGSTSSLQEPVYPSGSNRYIVEADQGTGDQVDFHDPATGLAEAIREHPSIGQYGKTGALAHRIVYLEIDTSQGDLDYTRDILPRLIILFGRSPQFGDFLYNGTSLNFYNGSDWQTLG